MRSSGSCSSMQRRFRATSGMWLGVGHRRECGQSKMLGAISVAPSTSPARSGSLDLGRGVARHLKPDLLLCYLWLSPNLLQHLLAPIETPALIGSFDSYDTTPGINSPSGKPVPPVGSNSDTPVGKLVGIRDLGQVIEHVGLLWEFNRELSRCSFAVDNGRPDPPPLGRSAGLRFRGSAGIGRSAVLSRGARYAACLSRAAQSLLNVVLSGWALLQERDMPTLNNTTIERAFQLARTARQRTTAKLSPAAAGVALSLPWPSFSTTTTSLTVSCWPTTPGRR
jgi:hypothetical protein